MPNVNDLGKSKYLKQSDCAEPIEVTIKGYEKVDVSMQDQPSDYRYALFFEEEIKPLILNKTNGNRIAVIAGSADFDRWTGVRIELYNDEFVEYAGKITGGIRVRKPRSQSETQQRDNVSNLSNDDGIPF